MISLGLMRKTFREAWPVTLACGLGMLVFEAMLAYILPTFREELADRWLAVPFIQNILKGLLGTEMSDGIGPEMLNSFPWVHPFILALLCAHILTSSTRLPSGEIDRGTVDLLLGLPVSRWRLYVCESVMWFLGGLILLAMGIAGSRIGALLVGSADRLETSRLELVILNLLCLYLAVSGLTCAVSSFCDRRGRAIAVAFGTVLSSYLINILAQFWEPMREILFLSLLHYYRPLQVMTDSTWPLTDMGVLLGIALSSWLIGGIVFARRDICTV